MGTDATKSPPTRDELRQRLRTQALTHADAIISSIEKHPGGDHAALLHQAAGLLGLVREIDCMP